MPFKNPEKIKEYQKKYRTTANARAAKKKYRESEKWKIWHDEYVKGPGPTAYRKKYNKANSERLRLERKKRRDDCYDGMGGKCSDCGFNDYRALQIDHINGDGKKERHLSNRKEYYPNVLKSFLAGENRYQLLCCNCNWIKREVNCEYRKKQEETGQIPH